MCMCYIPQIHSENRPTQKSAFSAGFLTCILEAAERRSGAVRRSCCPGAGSAQRGGSPFSPSPPSSSLRPPPAAASPSSSRACLPEASSCSSSSWRCSSTAQLLPLSGGGQVGHVPAAAVSLRIRSHRVTGSAEMRKKAPFGEVRVLH